MPRGSEVNLLFVLSSGCVKKGVSNRSGQVGPVVPEVGLVR